jgi:Cof subfamily protein (haloacid dehalogenase superfamily)
VIATDLDRTLITEDVLLRPRTVAAVQAAEAAGLRVIVATGRMVQSTRRVIAPLGLPEPMVCYQGAVVAAADGRVLLHAPIELELAREAIAAVEAAGFPPNVYVEDELYVSRVTPESQRYADFQEIEIHEVGSLEAWLIAPATKLVCIGDPDELDGLGEALRERFAGRLWISKSLPYFLELAADGVSKGSGLEFLARRLGFSAQETVAFGDGENDVELLEWAGYAIAVDNAHERIKALADWVCPSVEDEGVASVIEALLHSRR